jgi:hypothetical protein
MPSPESSTDHENKQVERTTRESLNTPMIYCFMPLETDRNAPLNTKLFTPTLVQTNKMLSSYSRISVISTQTRRIVFLLTECVYSLYDIYLMGQSVVSIDV